MFKSGTMRGGSSLDVGGVPNQMYRSKKQSLRKKTPEVGLYHPNHVMTERKSQPADDFYK